MNAYTQSNRLNRPTGGGFATGNLSSFFIGSALCLMTALAASAATEDLRDVTESAELTSIAWQAYTNKDYALATNAAYRCIVLHSNDASGMERRLERENPNLDEFITPTNRTQFQAVAQNAAVNDVATCAFIFAICCREGSRFDFLKPQDLDRVDKALLKKARWGYALAASLPYGRCWDNRPKYSDMPQGGVFWTPAKEGRKWVQLIPDEKALQ